MKYLGLTLVLLCFLSMPLIGADSSNVFTIDMSKLLRFSDFGKKINLEKNIALKKLQSENKKLEVELLSEEKELSKLRKVLSSEEFRPKALEFDEKVSLIRTDQAKKEEDLKNSARKKESEFLRKIYPILYELVLERGGLVLLDQRNVVLWDSSVDITNDAIDEINQFVSEGLID